MWLVLRMAAVFGYKISAKARFMPTVMMTVLSLVMFMCAIASCIMWILATPDLETLKAKLA